MTSTRKFCIVLLLLVLVTAGALTHSHTAVAAQIGAGGADEPGPPLDKPALSNGSVPPGPVVIVDADRRGEDEIHAAAISAGPVIDVWYGDNQYFGHNGEPLIWVNILGNVSGDHPITSMTYNLNSTGNRALTLGVDGPSDRRLGAEGDFNVEIAYTDLNVGSNTVLLRATDDQSNVTTRTVTIEYTSGQSWSLPTYTDWADLERIDDGAQVVDGYWALDGGGVKPVQLDYDRLVAIGNMSWTDYEVTVPVTIHGIDAAGFPGPSYGPGLGLILNWKGHFQTGAMEEPRVGWSQFGAIGWFHWSRSGGNTTVGMQMLSGGAAEIASNNKSADFDTPYIFKMQVKSVPSAPSQFKMKVWEADTQEPAAWDMEGTGTAGALRSGSMMLVAHHVEATFGRVTITPLNYPRLTLDVAATTGGSFDTLPVQTDYLYGDVVTVTATAQNGYAFTGWTGDIVESTNPLVFHIEDDTSLTANFEATAFQLELNEVGNGSVSATPQKPEYGSGETIALSATPDTGWQFAGWSGGVSGVEPEIDLVIMQDEVVTGTFEQEHYVVDVELVDENGSAVPAAGNISLTPPADPAGYVYGENATLTVTPADGWDFEQWTGDLSSSSMSESIVVTGSLSIAGKMVRKLYSLNTDVTGEGTVQTNKVCPCAYQEVVQLTAIPDTKWDFVGWSGALSGTTSPAELTMAADQSVTATFVQTKFDVITPVSGQGRVDRTIPGPYAANTSVSLLAVSEPGWRFTGWSGDVTASTNPLTVQINEDQSIVANFARESTSMYLPLILR